jgi:hypothetical protein
MKNEDIYADRNFMSRGENRKQWEAEGYPVYGPGAQLFLLQSRVQIINRVSAVYRLLNRHHFSGSGKSICEGSGFLLSRLSRE